MNQNFYLAMFFWPFFHRISRLSMLYILTVSLNWLDMQIAFAKNKVTKRINWQDSKLQFLYILWTELKYKILFVLFYLLSIM